MVKVANLSADLTANTSSFDQNLTKASRKLNKTGRSMSRDAESFNKKVSNSFRKAAQSTAALEGPLGGTAGRLSSLATIAGTTGVAIGAVTLAISGTVLALKQAATVGDRFEGSMERVEAIIKATGGAAGVSAMEIREFSQELARGTLASVEGVEAASAKLLTFRRIAGDTFKRTLTLAQDLAATGFGSLSDNVTQLGKALEDPINNLGALTRNGVSFTEQQKEVIKSLVETGKAAEAQGLILDALAGQVGGAGAAEGGSITAAYDSLTQSVDNFWLSLDDKTGAGDSFTTFLDTAREGIESLTTLIDPKEDTLIKKLSDQTIELAQLVNGASAEFAELVRLGRSESEATAFVESEIEAQRSLVEGLQERVNAETELATKIKETSIAQQEKITADAAAGVLEKERIKQVGEAAKLEEKRQETIRSTIEGLNQSIVALIAEQEALSLNNASLEEAATLREILLEQQKLGIDATSEEGKAIDELIRKRNALNEALADEKKQRARVAQILKDNKSETEKLNDELKELEELRKRGLLTEEEYQKAVKRTKEKIEELDESQKALKETLEDVADATKGAFKDFVTGAKTASEAVRALAIELAGLIFDKTVGAGIEDIITGKKGGPFERSFGGFFADGGRPPLGQVSVVGERGPELFVPDTAGTIIPNGGGAGVSGGGTTIYADMRGASVEAVARLELLVSELNASIEPRAVDAVVEQKQRNPALFGE